MADRIKVRIQSENDPRGFQEFDRLVDKSRREVEGMLNQIKRGVGFDLGGRLTQSIADVPRVFRQALAEGVDINAFERRAVRAIGAIVKKFTDVPSLDEAFTVSEGVVSDLRELAQDVSSDFATLLENLQLNAGSMFKGGITDLDQMIDLTATLAESVKGVGLVDPRQAVQESRALLTGNIGPDATLANIVGITKQDIDRAIELGELYPFLTEKLKEFREAGAVAAGEYDGALSNFNAQLASLKKELAAPLFELISESAKELKEALQDGDLRAELGEIGEGIAEVLENGKDFLVWVTENHRAVVSLVGMLVKFGAALAALKLARVVAGLTATGASWVAETRAVQANTAALTANAAARAGAAGAAGLVPGKADRAGKRAERDARDRAAKRAFEQAKLDGMTRGAAVPFLAAGGMTAFDRFEKERAERFEKFEAEQAKRRKVSPVLGAISSKPLGSGLAVASAALIGHEIGKAINAAVGERLGEGFARLVTDNDAVELANRINRQVGEAFDAANATPLDVEAWRQAEAQVMSAIDEIDQALTNARGSDKTFLEGALLSLQVKLDRLEARELELKGKVELGEVDDVEVAVKVDAEALEKARKKLEAFRDSARAIDDGLVDLLVIRGDVDFTDGLERQISNAQDRMREALEAIDGLKVEPDIDTEGMLALVRSTEVTLNQRKELIPLLRDLVRLERELTDAREDAAESAREAAEDAEERLRDRIEAVDKEQAAEAKKAADVGERRRDYADELAILQARAAGNTALADQLEREREIRLESLRIQRDLQLSEAEALGLARAKVDAEIEAQETRERGERNRLPGRIDPTPNDDLRDPLGGRSALGRDFPRLAELERLQDRPLRDEFQFPRLEAFVPAQVTAPEVQPVDATAVLDAEVPNKSQEELRRLRASLEGLLSKLGEADEDNADLIDDIAKRVEAAEAKVDRTLEQIRNSRD